MNFRCYLRYTQNKITFVRYISYCEVVIPLLVYAKPYEYSTVNSAISNVLEESKAVYLNIQHI